MKRKIIAVQKKIKDLSDYYLNGKMNLKAVERDKQIKEALIKDVTKEVDQRIARFIAERSASYLLPNFTKSLMLEIVNKHCSEYGVTPLTDEDVEYWDIRCSEGELLWFNEPIMSYKEDEDEDEDRVLNLNGAMLVEWLIDKIYTRCLYND